MLRLCDRIETGIRRRPLDVSIKMREFEAIQSTKRRATVNGKEMQFERVTDGIGIRTSGLTPPAVPRWVDYTIASS